MKPSSSSSDVFAGVLARGGVAEQVSGRAWLQALLDFEAALARAQARAGSSPPRTRDAIAAACDADRFDVAEIGAGAAEIGNPAGAVVKALNRPLDAPVHHGATSQDAVDTAVMLVAKRALVPLLDDLRGAADAAAALAQAAPRHADHRPRRCCSRRSRPRSGSRPRAGWSGSTRPPAGLPRVRLAVPARRPGRARSPRRRSKPRADLGLERR